MMENTNKDWVAMSDRAIVKALGVYLKAKRLELNKTQAQIANEAGLNRYTLGQLENGESINLITLIQILRALDEFHLLDGFQIEEKISPIEYAKLKKNKRQRANSPIDDKTDKEDLGW
ncbi:MAG: helix-turn-helix transcriptional regulator [Reichenbachiella sp.]